MLSRDIFNLCQQCFHNVFIKDDFLQLLSRMSSSFFKTISKLFQDQLQALLENQQSVQDNHQPSFSKQSSTFFFKTIFSLPFKAIFHPSTRTYSIFPRSSSDFFNATFLKTTLQDNIQQAHLQARQSSIFFTTTFLYLGCSPLQ